MHLALIKYSVLRLAFFVASLALLWLVGVRRSLLMLILASLISLALSYLLLGKQRDALAVSLAQRVEARSLRREGVGQADADEEDAAIEAAAAPGGLDRDVRKASEDKDARAQVLSERQTDGQ